MNTPVSLTSIATDIADLRVKSSKYITDYTVSLVVNENTDKDSDEKYIYSYLVKFNYCNMYTITGMLHSGKNGDYITGTTIKNAYLCDGKLYHPVTKLPYVIRGYSEIQATHVLYFSLHTFMTSEELFIKVDNITGIENVSLPTGYNIREATYDKLLNTVIVGNEIENFITKGYPLHPIMIENYKHESVCFVDIYTHTSTTEGGKETWTHERNPDVLPVLDLDLNLLKIPCFVIKENVKQ